MNHPDTIAAIYQPLELRGLKMLAGEDSATAEVIVGTWEVRGGRADGAHRDDVFFTNEKFSQAGASTGSFDNGIKTNGDAGSHTGNVVELPAGYSNRRLSWDGRNTASGALKFDLSASQHIQIHGPSNGAGVDNDAEFQGHAVKESLDVREHDAALAAIF